MVTIIYFINWWNKMNGDRWRYGKMYKWYAWEYAHSVRFGVKKKNCFIFFVLSRNEKRLLFLKKKKNRLLKWNGFQFWWFYFRLSVHKRTREKKENKIYIVSSYWNTNVFIYTCSIYNLSKWNEMILFCFMFCVLCVCLINI